MAPRTRPSKKIAPRLPVQVTVEENVEAKGAILAWYESAREAAKLFLCELPMRGEMFTRRTAWLESPKLQARAVESKGEA